MTNISHFGGPPNRDVDAANRFVTARGIRFAYREIYRLRMYRALAGSQLQCFWEDLHALQLRRGVAAGQWARG